jgi:hypothetical protein
MGPESKKDGAGNILSRGSTFLIIRKIIEAMMVIIFDNLTGDHLLEFIKIKYPPVGIGMTTNADLQTVTMAMEIGASAINFPIGGFG